jgi:hypothetical protein
MKLVIGVTALLALWSPIIYLGWQIWRIGALQ